MHVFGYSYCSIIRERPCDLTDDIFRLFLYALLCKLITTDHALTDGDSRDS